MVFNELQRQVAEYDRRFGWTSDRPEQTVLHMQEELGEISRELLKAGGYKKGGFDAGRLNDEITDLLYLTLKLGNLMKLDLDRGWEKIQGRYGDK